MSTFPRSLPNNLRFAAVAVGLLLLVGCWENIPYTGPIAGSAESPFPKVESNRTDEPNDGRVADQSVQSPAESEPFLGEDIFADSSSMFDAEVLGNASLDGKPLDAESSVEKTQNLAPHSTLQSQNTRQLVWKLGFNQCMAAIHYQPPSLALNSKTPREESQQAATELLLELPESQDNPFADLTELAAQEALETLLPMGRRLGKQINSEYDPEHVALFEVGFKSSMLLVLYEPESPMNGAMISTIESGSKRANLPLRLWQPLVDALQEKQPRAAIEQMVFELHEAVLEFLAD